LASDASPLFRRLLDAGLINESSFSYEYFEGSGYASVIFSGESKNPDAVADEIKKEIMNIREQGLNPAAFNRSKKAVYGRIISSFNSVDYLANAMAADAFAGRELFQYIDAVASADIKSVQDRLNRQLMPEYSALSIVKPVD
jgi:predicted Zn-dependent peptidase